MYSDNLKFITYIDITNYSENLVFVKIILKKSINLCKLITTEHHKLYCVQTLKFFNIQLPSLIKKEKTINDIIGNNRQKRGLLNFIGSAAKSLFGTMDSNDAEYYDEVI